jgi:hypothetical protein
VVPRALIAVVGVVACSNATPAEATKDAAVPKPACESLDVYCARNPCLREGVRSTADFQRWCLRVGPFSSSFAGESTCGAFVIFDATRSETSTEHWFDSATGKLLWVLDFRSGVLSCAGVEPDRTQCVRVGVGNGCTGDAGDGG